MHWLPSSGADNTGRGLQRNGRDIMGRARAKEEKLYRHALIRFRISNARGAQDHLLETVSARQERTLRRPVYRDFDGGLSAELVLLFASDPSCHAQLSLRGTILSAQVKTALAHARLDTSVL